MAQSKRKAKPSRSRAKTSKFVLPIGALVSLPLITAIAFVSPQLSVMALVFLAFSGFLYYENDKRNFWQSSTNAKLERLKAEQDRLEAEVTIQRFELDDVKNKVKQLNDNNALPEHNETEDNMFGFKNRPKRPTYSSVYPQPRAPRGEAVRAKEAATAAKKPVRKDPPLISSKPANYDPHADYDALSDMVVKELINYAVQNNQIDVFVQPIMRLPQRQPRFYEVFARIRAKPGMYLPASRYIKLARADKQMNKIDHLLLMQCLETIKKTAAAEGAIPFFINITTATMSNSLFMKQLLGFLSKNRSLGPRLVFEIKQAEFNNLQPAILQILRGLGQLGCAFSIDHVEKMEFDIKLMQVLKVRYVKVDAQRLLSSVADDKIFNDINRFKRKLEGNGIGFIVEKVESEDMLKKILDFDINYGQGYLFGRPDFESAYKRSA